MINNKITASIVSIATGASLLLSVAVLPVSADTTTVSTTTAKSQANQAARLTKVISASDQEITARISALNALSTRVQGMVNVPASEKTNISNEVQSEITNLTNLKAKIDADTDLSTAETDRKSIVYSYRVYMLVVPQANLIVASDRVTTITGMMTTISSNLQTRITADQNAGKDVSALQTALTDLNAKLADANTQASTAQTGIASLTPDQGNTTIAASNKAALTAARANIKTATSDLQAARKDAQTITKGLKALGDNTTATTTSQ